VGDCYLSHQRLAIIDPASGDQPLFFLGTEGEPPFPLEINGNTAEF